MSVADKGARKGAEIAISKAGKVITFVREGDPVEDDDTGIVTPTLSEESLKAVETQVSFRMIDGSRVKATDMMFLIAAAVFEKKFGADALPTTDDRIKVGSRNLAITLVKSISSGEQWALHKMVVSR